MGRLCFYGQRIFSVAQPVQPVAPTNYSHLGGLGPCFVFSRLLMFEFDTRINQTDFAACDDHDDDGRFLQDRNEANRIARAFEALVDVQGRRFGVIISVDYAKVCCATHDWLKVKIRSE